MAREFHPSSWQTVDVGVVKSLLKHIDTPASENVTTTPKSRSCILSTEELASTLSALGDEDEALTNYGNEIRDIAKGCRESSALVSKCLLRCELLRNEWGTMYHSDGIQANDEFWRLGATHLPFLCSPDMFELPSSATTADEFRKKYDAAPVLVVDAHVDLLEDLAFPDLKQAAKDIRRDEAIINGQLISGRLGLEPIVLRIQELLDSDVPSDSNKVRALVLLNLLNRTFSSGSLFDAAHSFYHSSEYGMIVPDSRRSEPLQLIILRSGDMRFAVLKVTMVFSCQRPPGLDNIAHIGRLRAHFTADLNVTDILTEELVGTVAVRLLNESLVADILSPEFEAALQRVGSIAPVDRHGPSAFRYRIYVEKGEFTEQDLWVPAVAEASRAEQ